MERIVVDFTVPAGKYDFRVSDVAFMPVPADHDVMHEVHGLKGQKEQLFREDVMRNFITKICRMIAVFTIAAVLALTAVPALSPAQVYAANAPSGHDISRMFSIYTVNAAIYSGGKNHSEGVFFTTAEKADAATAIGYTISVDNLYKGTMSLDNFYKAVLKYFNNVSKSDIEKVLKAGTNPNTAYDSASHSISFSGGAGKSSLHCVYESHTKNGSVYTVIGRWEDSEHSNREYDDIMLSAVYKGGSLKILSYGTPIELTKNNISLQNTAYNGGKAVKPTVKGKKGITLTKYDYTFGRCYYNKSIGTATATVEGVGRYTGKVVKSFKIVPKAPSLKSVKAGSKKITVKYGKASGGSGTYQIAYKAEKGKWKYITSYSTSAVISKLTKGKTYSVRVRGVGNAGGKKYYGIWSDVKTAVVK